MVPDSTVSAQLHSLRRISWPLAIIATALLSAGHGPLVAGDAAAGAGPIRFEEFLIAGDYGYSFAVNAADIDGDGDLDLTNGDTTKNFFYWFENDGKGKFTRHVIQKDEAGWFERHHVADINGDGKLDVAVVKNLDGHLVWFENSGNPKAADVWKRHVITTDLKRAYDVEMVDLNGDGRPDAAASAWVGNHFAWFENPGPNAAGEWKKHLIDDEIAETRTICSADFNADGKPDLLGTARVGDLTVWYENTGKPAGGKWPRHVIDAKSHQPTHGHPVDMDNDGDLDVLMAHGMLAQPESANTNRIVWYENVGKPGKGTEWKMHVVGPLNTAFEAVAGDVDADGDLDIAATAWGTGQVLWFENGGDPKGEKTKWKMHLLKETWPRANQVIFADLNGDKRPDIAASAERGANELRWWKNAGK